MLRPVLAAAALLLTAAAPALAQEGARLAFTLGAGVSSVPTFFGSDEAEVGPSFSVSSGFLRFGGLSLGSEDPNARPTGLGFKGSFRYIPERDAGDLGVAAADVDATFELGGGIRYAQPWYEAFAVARYGIGGSDAVVADLGMDLIARPSDRLELRAGPRLLYGSDQYAETYFSTGTDPAAPGGFDASGGLLSTGVEVGATYDLTDRWGLSATARFDRLEGDAATSPISAEDDQVSATLELTRRFDFQF